MAGLREVTLLIILAIPITRVPHLSLREHCNAHVRLRNCGKVSKTHICVGGSECVKGLHDASGPKGEVVLVEAYHMGMNVIALAAGFQSTHLRHLNPISAPFYTIAYRWSLRYLSLIPKWLGHQSMSYPDTHKVWRRRFYYMDVFVPSWIRPLIPYVSKNDWIEEEKQYARYVRYAEHTFGKHNRYPSSKIISEEQSKEPVSSESNPTP